MPPVVVDYDPFAPKARPAPPSAATVVDYDPFAAPAPKPRASSYNAETGVRDLGAPAAPVAPGLKPVPRSAQVAAPPPAPPQPGVLGVVGRHFREDYQNRVNSGLEQIGEALNADRYKPTGNPVADAANYGLGGLQLIGGAFNYVGAPVLGPIDTAFGRPVEKATGAAPHGEHYDLRLPRTIVGDVAGATVMPETLKEAPGLRAPEKVNGRVVPVDEAGAPIPKKGARPNKAAPADKYQPSGNAVVDAVKAVQAAGEYIGARRGARGAPAVIDHDPFAEPAVAEAAPVKAKAAAPVVVDHDPFAVAEAAAPPARAVMPERAVAEAAAPGDTLVTERPPVVVDRDPFAAGGGGGEGPPPGEPPARGGGGGDEPPPAHRPLDAEPVGPVYGDEAKLPERIDNALYRNGGHATADKAEAAQFLESLPPEIADPAVQARLYDEIEKKLANPAHEIEPGLRPAFEAMRPWYEEQTAVANRIRAKNPDLADTAELPVGEGYVHRKVKGKGSLYDELDGVPRDGARDPITGGRGLAKTTSSLQGRRFFVLEGPDGKRLWVKTPDPGWREGQKISGSFGDPYVVRRATTAEIEANTPVRYHRNAVVNTVDNVLRLRRVERNIEVLDRTLEDAKAQGLAHREEWHVKNDRGEWVRYRANEPTPKTFVRLDHIPQLRGWAFDPKVANVLKDYHPAPEAPLWKVLGDVNRVITGTLFWNPLIHGANVLNHWIIGRGWDWMTPGGYKSLALDGVKAVREVLTMGPEYRRMLREGSALLYADTHLRDFHQLMLQKAGAELTGDPQTWKALARAFALGDMTPVQLVKLIYRTSGKALWAMNDIFMLQRTFELQRKGMATRAAIHEAERDIPNYRVPAEVMGSRAVSEALKSPNLLLFGRYRYGQIRAWGEMFRDLWKGGPEGQRMDALGKFLVAMLTAQVIYPAADYALRLVTGRKDDKDVRVKRFGAFSIPDAAVQMTKQQKDWSAFVSTLVIPAPVPTIALEAGRNLDFAGRKIVEPQSTPLGQAVQAGEYAAGKIQPLQQAMGMAKEGGVPRELGKMVGLDIPPEGREQVRERAKRFDRRRAMKRERKDPILRAIRGED